MPMRPIHVVAFNEMWNLQRDDVVHAASVSTM